MKRLVLYVAVFITMSFAMPVIGQDYYVGLITGLNYSDMDMVTMRIDHPVDSRSSFGVGGIIGLRLNNNISFQVEPMYLQKGGVANILEDQNLNMNMKFTSIEVPLLLKVSFGQMIQPYIITGPTFSIITSAEGELSVGTFSFDTDIANITTDFEVGLAWGAGISYYLGGGFIFLEGIYTVGLTNINKGGNLGYNFGGETLFDMEIAKEDKFKNKSLRIMAGFIFPLNE